MPTSLTLSEIKKRSKEAQKAAKIEFDNMDPERKMELAKAAKRMAKKVQSSQ